MINGAIVIYIRNPEAHSYQRQRQLKLHSRRRRLYQHSRTAFCFPHFAIFSDFTPRRHSAKATLAY